MKKVILNFEGERHELTTDKALEQGDPECNVLLDAVKAIRASDCGAWLKDCQTGLFRCSDGREKRLELSRLLDKLYKAAGI